jgi:predicted HicB family RNase H-like nuclease
MIRKTAKERLIDLTPPDAPAPEPEFSLPATSPVHDAKKKQKAEKSNVADEVEVDEENQVVDNIEAAMNKVAETLTPTISPVAKEDDRPISDQVLIRCFEEEKQSWKEAAQLEGKSMSEWIRNILNNESFKKLVCQHPFEYRRVLPWSERCTKCNKRLR